MAEFRARASLGAHTPPHPSTACALRRNMIDMCYSPPQDGASSTIYAAMVGVWLCVGLLKRERAVQ